MDNENKTYTLALGLGAILSLAYHISSAITGAAVLARSYTGYNTKEATIMASIGAPFTMLVGLITSACSDNENSKINILNTCIGAVVSSLIGYGIYNEVDKTTMGLGQTAAASAVGASILVLPLLGVSLCCAAALFYSTLESNEEDSLNSLNSRIEDTLEQIREIRENIEKRPQEMNSNNAIEIVETDDIRPVLEATAVTSADIGDKQGISPEKTKSSPVKGFASKMVNDYLKVV